MIPPKFGASRIALRRGCSTYSTPSVVECVDGVERLVDGPPLVDVDHEREVSDAAYGANPFDVEPVAAAKLQLEPPEPRGRGGRAASHVVGVAEPYGP